MIKKQNMWFLTLFSLILVLSIYYVTIPNQLLLTDNNMNINNFEVLNNTEDSYYLQVSEMDYLEVLRVSKEVERLDIMNDLQLVLNSIETSTIDKNNAYEQIKLLTTMSAMEEKLETKILDNHELNSFVKIDNNEIRVTISSNEHSQELANEIMRTIQEEYETKMYISVKFE